MVVNSGLCVASMPSLRKMRPISYTRSSPPTMHIFRCSSVAMRIYMSISSALWCVMNGRAEAPEAVVLSTGVSTSMKPLAFRRLRISAMIFERFTNVSRTSGFTMRSTKRWR